MPWSGAFYRLTHVPVPRAKPPPNRQWTWQRDWRNLSLSATSAWLSVAPLQHPEAEPDPTTRSRDLLSALQRMVDSICPLRRRKITIPYHSRQAWYSPELAAMKRQGRRLERAWRKQGTAELKLQLSTHYRAYHERISIAKRSYLANKLQAAPNSTKQLFRLVSDFSTTKPLPLFPPSVQKCDEIAEFFDSKICIIRDTIQKGASLTPAGVTSPCSPKATQSPSIPLVLFSTFALPSVSDLVSILSHLGPSSSKLDPLPTPLVKSLAPLLAPLITPVVNSSLRHGVVPPSWKKGLITPLLKKSGLDPAVLKNLRPVSQLPLLSRLTESIVVTQLQSHCEATNVLHDLQSGFRPTRGTETALVDIRERLLELQDRSRPAALVLLDLSAAFDTIDHGILLQRLACVAGITGTALEWCRSFLADRVQQVRLGDTLSGERAVACGVPQGSALSPLFFNIYMRPLADLLEDSGLGFQMYADDTQIVVDLGLGSTQGEALVDCLVRVRGWMGDNWLLLNEGKTEFLLSGPARPPDFIPPWPASFGSPPVPAESVRNLGVWFHQSGGASAQAKRTARAAHHQLNRLSPLMPLLAPVHRATLCQALVLSKVAYCNSFYSGLAAGDVRRLQKVQNRATRMVWGLRRFDHVSEARRRLGWLTISDQVKVKGLVIMWRALHQQGPSYLQRRFSWHSSSRPTRLHLRGRVTVPRARRTRALGAALSLRGPLWWNSLPPEIRLAGSLGLFKRRVISHLRAQDV